MHWREVIRRPIITEKSSGLAALDQYAFVVDPRANKIMIKHAIEQAFDVTVEKVRILNMPAKRGRSYRNRQMRIRKSEYKKAIVTLSEGSIELFEGV
ncbi:MAG: 50S ribosomal protein L23 [Ardenticatenaceae bacterium]|nr:50S ribosomal protein L23 [Ardenticatenaceae bacterium]